MKVLLTIILSCVVASLGQEPWNPSQYAAPILWTEYRLPTQNVSFAFPKLPVVREFSDPCSQTDGAFYSAFAAGAVYEFSWHAKSTKAVPINGCSKKTKFSKAAFTNRIDELKARKPGHTESEATVAGTSATAIRSISSSGSIAATHWFVWKKDRWFELTITRRKDTVVDEGRFSAGLKLSSSRGRDIGSGSDSTLGDSDVDLKSDSSGRKPEGIVILTKPRPGYTEEARQASIQGTVIVRVTFLSHGGIGAISVVKGLPLGLTDEAIAAAKRIAFLPQTLDGKPVTIIKQVEYTFGIY